MSVAGGAVGLLAGGLLVTYASWRWVLFVNVPIGIGAALAALVVLPGTARRPGRFDLPGAITGTGGVAALVYGLSNAATSPDGTSHWGDAKVVAALTAGVVLLAAFAVHRDAQPPCAAAGAAAAQPGPSRREPHDAGRGDHRLRRVLLPDPVRAGRMGLLRAQDGSGVPAASPPRCWRPPAAAAQLVPRIGARPLLLAGAAASAGGLYWLSRMTEHGTYAGGLLGPMLVIGVGLGLLFVPLSLVALARVGRGGLRRGLQPAQHRPAGRRGPSASRCWAPWPGRWSPTTPAPTPPRRGRLWRCGLPARAGGRLRPRLRCRRRDRRAPPGDRDRRDPRPPR